MMGLIITLQRCRVTSVFQNINNELNTQDGASHSDRKHLRQGRLTSILPSTKMARRHVKCRQMDAASREKSVMKPKWIRVRKKEKMASPGGVLQTGILVFGATCGATLFLAACNSN